MKIYIIIFLFFILGKESVFSQTLINDGDAICNLLMNEFGVNGINGPNVVCLWIENQNVDNNGNILPTVVTLDCEITIGDDQELLIPNNTEISLTGNGKITLNGNGKITGEQINGSKITNETSGVTINLTDCMGCKISNLNVTGGENATGKDGITIDENSSGNEIDNVKIDRLENGILIKSDGNFFTDIQFERVGGNTECDPRLGPLNYGIKIENSNSNEFTNILHTKSPGAITLWLNEECDENIASNITVEQEGSDCPKLPIGGDPSLFVDSDDSSGNFIITNFNGGRIFLQTTSCDPVKQNTVVPRPNCNNAIISTCGN